MIEKSKSITRNYIYNTIYTSLNILFPLITVPYLARILLPAGMGKVNLATNIVSWFVLFAALGIQRYGTREVAKTKKDSKQLDKLFLELFSINAIATIIVSFVYYIAVFFVPVMQKQKILYMVVGIQILFNMCNVDWFYQGMEDYLYITKRSILIKSLSLIAIFIFVKNKEDYIVYALILTIATVGNYIFNIIHLKNYIGLSKYHLDLKKHFAPVCILFSTQIAVSLYALLDTTMIGLFCEDENVGYYSNIVVVVKMIVTVITALGTVLLPRITILVQKGEKNQVQKLVDSVLELLLFLSIPACAGLIIEAKEIVYIFLGSKFAPSVMTLHILAFLIPIMSVGNLFGTQLLMAYDLEKKLLLSVVCGACVNIVLNSILIIPYKQNGAAFASVITELLVMCMQIGFSSRHIKIKWNFFDLVKIILANIIMVCVVIVTKSLTCNAIINMLISVLCGGTVYILLCMVFRVNACLMIIDKIKKYIRKEM